MSGVSPLGFRPAVNPFITFGGGLKTQRVDWRVVQEVETGTSVHRLGSLKDPRFPHGPLVWKGTGRQLSTGTGGSHQPPEHNFLTPTAWASPWGDPLALRPSGGPGPSGCRGSGSGSGSGSAVGNRKAHPGTTGRVTPVNHLLQPWDRRSRISMKEIQGWDMKVMTGVALEGDQ